MNKTNFFFLFLSLFCFATFGQDVHLSQFYRASHLQNPATVGDFKGDFRLSGNYRNQWRQVNASPLNTFLISFDKAFRYYSHEFDYGILLVNDRFSGFNTETSKVLFSLGYGRAIKGHNIRIGIQPGMVFRRTDLSLQTFPDQWDYAQGDFSGPNPDNGDLGTSTSFFDLNLGVQWSKVIGSLEPKVGFALNHINRPKDTFFGNTKDRLRMRKVLHAAVDYSLTSIITLEPRTQWIWTTNSNNFMLGSNVGFGFPDRKVSKVFGGVFYRHGISRAVDALVPTAGLSYKQFDFGISYDVNVSALSQDVDRRGTLEFSLMYTGKSSKPEFIALPCDRY